MRLVGLIAAGFVLAAGLGCAGAPAGERTVLEGNPARTLLVLPFNVTVPMPPELEAFSPFVWEQLELYLRQQGKQLKTASVADSRRLWLRSIREARAGEAGARADFDDAVAALARELARHADFDTLLLPSLVMRKAPVAGRSASWDGVDRVVEVEPGGGEARRIPADLQLEGVLPAASLHTVVVDAGGGVLHEGFGGLELLVRIRTRGSPLALTSKRELAFATRTELFSEQELLWEGIALALAPYLPRLPLVSE